MNTRVTETIFSSADMVIPMSSVQHIEKHMKGGALTGIKIITDKTKWNFQYDTWENPIYLSSHDNHAESFLKAFCNYIAERDGMTESPIYKEKETTLSDMLSACCCEIKKCSRDEETEGKDHE